MQQHPAPHPGRHNIDDLIANPRQHFDTPRAVLSSAVLAPEQKRKVLESWKFDAERLAESTDENMSGGEQSDLGEVSRALSELDETDDIRTNDEIT